MDYLCDEVVPFVDERYPTLAGREHRGLAGKSSGGYGAMVVPMLRPDVFGALASHAGDALFEAATCASSRRSRGRCATSFDGSYEVFFERLAQADHFDCATVRQAVRDLRLRRALLARIRARPGEALLPFDVRPGG